MNTSPDNKNDNKMNSSNKTDLKNEDTSNYNQKNTDSGTKKFDGSANTKIDVPPIISKSADSSKAAPSEKK